MKKHVAISGIVSLLIFSFSFSSIGCAHPYHVKKKNVVVSSCPPYKSHVCVSGYWKWNHEYKEYVWAPSHCKHKKRPRPTIWLSWHW